MIHAFNNKWKILIVLTLIYTAYHFLFKSHHSIAQMPGGFKPQVSVAPVLERKVQLWNEYSGRLVAPMQAQVRPRVSGMIESIHFKDGAIVKKNDLLFTLDQRSYLSEVERLQGNLSSIAAQETLAISELNRVEPLIKDNLVSASEYETRKNAVRVAQANLQSASAALKTAKLHLEFTQLRAPISGRISRAELTVGNLVEAGPTALSLATIVSSHPIYADFEIDEKTYLKYIKANPKIDDLKSIPVQMTVGGQNEVIYNGSLDSFDNQLNSHSGTIRVRALFENENMLLVPGLFARVKLADTYPTHSILITERAIGTDQNKKFVLVIAENNTLSYREIKLGSQLENLRIIESGLQPGDKIVVNGLQRARPGQEVAAEMVAMDSTTNEAVNVAKKE